MRVNKKFYLLFTTFIIFSIYLYAEDLTVPVMKAPIPVEEPQFDISGDYIAYTIKNRVFIRDTLSLVLQDSYPKNNQSEITAFYASPQRAGYPQVVAKPDGNSVVILARKDGASDIKQKVITDLPSSVKAAAVNHNQGYMAFLGKDGKAYVYDLLMNKVTASFDYYLSSSDIFFTSDDKILVADTPKTGAFYNLTGQKIKTFTCGNNISAITLSPDDETVVIGDSTGGLSFYNTDSSVQIGYSPALGTKNIKQIRLCNDSSKIVVTGRDGTMCVTDVSNILFAPNTIAPKPQEFVFKYSQIDPTKKDEIITEFKITEDVIVANSSDAEYITTTQEKIKGIQNFEIDEKTYEPPVVIQKIEPQQQYFPPTVLDEQREVTLSNKEDEVRTKTTITEYKQPEAITTPVASPLTKQSEPKATVTEFSEEKTQTAAAAPAASDGKKKRSSKKANATVVDNTADQEVADATTPVTIIINGLGNGDGSGTGEGSGDEENSGKTKNKEKAPKKKAEETKSPLEEPLKDLFDLDEKEFVAKFKDGQGILVNVGATLLPKTFTSKSDVGSTAKENPFLFELSLPSGYRNYNILKPFYFGGTLDPYVGFPQYEFPYSYKVNGTYLSNPKLLGFRIYAPFGLCMYPLQNSFEVYTEIGLGMSLNFIWNGQYAKHAIFSKPFPAFYSIAKVGVAWDFINFSICGTYDAMFGVAASAELGVCINLGGSRFVGGSRLK